MKPAAFEYHDPTTSTEAIDLLARFGEDARPLAGGQSLVPLMNFRLARPEHLVDLNGVPELNFLDNATRAVLAALRERAWPASELESVLSSNALRLLGASLRLSTRSPA